MSNYKEFWMLGILLIIIVAIFAGIELLQAKQDSPMKPRSIVTTFKDSPQTSRAFTWYTLSPDAATVIQMAEGSGITNFEEADVTTQTGTTSMIDTGDAGLQGSHKVNVTRLNPGTFYTYRVGNGEPNGWSNPAVFKTEGINTTEFTFINVTDPQGITEEDFKLWGKTLDQAFKTFPDASFIVNNGDLTENPENEASWNYFFDYTQAWLNSYSLMPATGNHDEVDGNAERFLSHFNLPDNGAKDVNPGTSYSFDYGTAHFIFLNSESKVKKQTEWLRADLSATNQPWIIVAMHHGPYGGNQKKSTVDSWVPLFDEFGVDLVLQGHNHEYSRSYPLLGNQIVEDGSGTVYVVTNASGGKLNEKKEDQFYHRVHLQNGKPMFAGIRINGDTLKYEAYDIDGLVIDEFNLTNKKA
jgi:hypothetical protein